MSVHEGISRPAREPLERAAGTLQSAGRIAAIGVWTPLPILFVSLGAFTLFEPHWYRDLFLILIALLFTAGQAFATVQLRTLARKAREAKESIAVLAGSADEANPERTRVLLLEKAPESPVRDLVVRWIDAGMRGQGGADVLSNERERRAIEEDKSMGIHGTLNRTILKMGFLGTLIGLLMTFPPMKSAILGLRGSEGEMRFVTDIANAIDGDEYAILATLVATGVSILLELLVLQVIERAYRGFDLAESHLADWNLVFLQPAIRRRLGMGNDGSPVRHSPLEQEMQQNLQRLSQAVEQTSANLEALAHAQAAIGRRIAELGEYERQYRTFLQVKQESSAPAWLRPDV